MITTEQYATLKSIAEDIFKANAYDAKLKVKYKAVDQETDKIYERHDIEGTKAAILLGLIKQSEAGLSIVTRTAAPKEKEPAKPIEDQIDEFTAAELEARGDVQQPTVDQLQHPSYVDMVKKVETKPDNFTDGQPVGDVILDNAAKPKDALRAVADPEKGRYVDKVLRPDGDIFADEKGRVWEIVNGKKVQRKKGTPVNA